MSDDITRISLDEVDRIDRTDWNRVRALTDDEIEASAAADPDTFTVEDDDLDRGRAKVRYLITTDDRGEYRWRLEARDGEVLALSAKSFPSRESAMAAIAELRKAMAEGRAEAA